MLIKNWKLFQLTDSTHEAPHHLWRNHWRWWVWNASGKREYARNARVGETWTHWIFAQTTCLLECAWFPSSFPLLSRLILESSTQNAYYCWKGLWGSIWCVGGSLRWDWGRGLWASCALWVDDTSCILSGWPALAFTFCLPPVATNWQLMCTYEKLRGTLQLGLMDAPCFVGVGAVVRCWQPVKADFGGWLAVPEMSDQFREICSQTAAHPFAASSWGCEGFGLVCLQANEQLSEMKL